ncbi:hypothetical protein ABZ816_04925 [Actinosynnema sp. NPDC047251]|uniref:Uncharacterized protein n=1 Tax=Saccharothrix espanaensis (strain ATCC 51144 / DSM 44229 / JCM 9112 / NBRC 15066 / NRRL 15764) TaxID=1179773 RepID=K0JUV1_SACES|nr:hypothetical protein [Saccharothrix espanaensis]CCH31605.1 hypothetical protein BN6_43230 [Saccharothrix espanaensis DSM 44229]
MNAHPTTATPCHDPGFAQFLAALAVEEAPRLFAVAVEYDDREDTYIAAYGLAFADRSEVVSTEGGFYATLQKPENALVFFTEQGEATPHLLWLPPAQERRRTPTTAASTSTSASTA